MSGRSEKANALLPPVIRAAENLLADVPLNYGFWWLDIGYLYRPAAFKSLESEPPDFEVVRLSLI